jgi:hypothetical protein
MSDENGTDNGGEETSPYLTRAKMLPVEGVVYCLSHDAVHEDTTDPYDYGTPDCKTKDHRPVYYRGRKGDLDEAPAARFTAGEPQHGTSEYAGELPEGSVIVDHLSEIQEQMVRRVIAASAEPLTGDERVLVSRLLKREYDRSERAYAELRELVGHGDLSPVESSLELLHSALGKLGAD